MNHRCTWAIRRWVTDDGTPEMELACGGPDGCGAFWAASGVAEIMQVKTWLEEHGYGER